MPHPLRENDPLFLAFDPNHLIKNLRTSFLEREMMAGEGSFEMASTWSPFEIWYQLLVKLARFLTRSHVEPNNLEKIKVYRATQIFQ